MIALVNLATYNPDDIKPGWIAFWIVVALGVATFLLWRSMNSQLRKIKAPYRDELNAAGTVDAGDTDPAQSPADHPNDESKGSTSGD
ncbi:MAG TPA: hypothetical protein VLK34_01515 [Nocardioidaceae bacterium]|nr:hypothetical protein [Nocardioidaceae bacterium]